MTPEPTPTRDVPVLTVRWSPAEVLRERDFASYTPAEFVEARRLMADLRLAGASTAVAPAAADARSGAARPTCAARCAGRCAPGGEPVHAALREPADAAAALVLLLDVSGSMEPYARAFVRFLHAAVVSRTRVEAFALGTRLTRVTRELVVARSRRRGARRGRSASSTGPGGTRLGDGLRAFNDEWGIRGHGARRDRRDPLRRLGPGRARRARRADGAARAGRVQDRVGEPAEGAARATRRWRREWRRRLPYVDEFVEGHSLAALEELPR